MIPPMAGKKIAAIMRAEAFSPDRVDDDAAILNAVCSHLRDSGHEVEVYSENQFIGSGENPEIVIGMYRQMPTIRHLQMLEETGSIVVNSAYGVENCTRERMTRILLGSGVPYPESLILNTGKDAREALEKAGFSACWIKRADSHTQHKDDVSFCHNAEEVQQMLQRYSVRGIKRAVINRHIEGDWIKFYGVAGTPFFHWFFPGEHSCHDNDLLRKLDKRIRETGEAAARALGVTVYGGDCILTAGGTPVVIDLNDWPSFAPCRVEAAPHIAGSILKSIQKNSEC